VLEKIPVEVDSRFRFVLLASRRAEQLMRGARPRIDLGKAKPTRTAVEELAQDCIRWSYGLPEAPVGRADFFRGLGTELKEHLYRTRTLDILRNPELKLFSRIGETEKAFRERCVQAAESEADREASKHRDRYESRLDTARRRRDQAGRRVRELEVDFGARRQQEVVAGAGELLSMFLGGRRRTRSLSGVASRRSQTRRTEERLRSAAEKMEDYEEAILDLEAELAEELEELWEKWREVAEAIEVAEIPLEKTDIKVEGFTLFWAPAHQ